MNLKKFVSPIVKISLVIFLAWLIPNPWIFSVELEKYNPKKAAACEKLVQKMTQPERVHFIVSYSFFTWLIGAQTFIPGKFVFFSPSYVNRKDFFVIAAHELGHIEYKTTNQVLADFFAMKFVGKERVIDSRKESGSPPDYLYAISTCYESDGEDCTDIPDFSITHILKQFLDSF